MTSSAATHDNLRETTPSPEFAFGEQFVSRDALTSLTVYGRLAEIDGTPEAVRAYEHPLRVATILHDFVGNKISQGAYDAAALHDIAQRIGKDHEHYKAARETLRSYEASIGKEAWTYNSGLLGDMDAIEECSQQGRHLITDTRDEHISSLLASSGTEDVPDYAWSIGSGLVSMGEISALLHDVNVEAAVVKCAEMLDNLQHPAPNPRALLQDIIDAESFYAPLCEGMGLQGLCMAIRSETAKLRLQHRGRDDMLTEAEGILSTLGERDQVLADVSGLFEHLLGSKVQVAIPVDNQSGHGIMLGHSTLNAHRINGDVLDSRIRWRVKSLGSLALKLDRFRNAAILRPDEPPKKPADVLGVTIIVDDMKALTMTYKGLVQCIKQNNVVEEGTLAGQPKTFSIQGSRSYVRSVSRSLADSGAEKHEFERVRKNNGHQVVKAMFMYLPHVVTPDRPEVAIPVELQIQTEADWKEGQEGTAAHLFYKAEVDASAHDHTAIRSIRDRMSHMNASRLNPYSHRRGEQFRQTVHETD